MNHIYKLVGVSGYDAIKPHMNNDRLSKMSSDLAEKIHPDLQNPTSANSMYISRANKLLGMNINKNSSIDDVKSELISGSHHLGHKVYDGSNTMRQALTKLNQNPSKVFNV